MKDDTAPLRRIGKCGMPEVRAPLKGIHKKKRMDWAKNNMKVNSQSVLFTDECRATLDGPDRWMRGWYCKESPRPERIRREQCRGGVMVWAAIIGNELVGPFSVSDGVKMTVKVYMDLLKKHLFPWYKEKKSPFRKNMVFMCDNTPFHAARLTTEYLNSVFARHGKIMQWPACSTFSPAEDSTPPRMITDRDVILTAAKDISSYEIEPKAFFSH